MLQDILCMCVQIESSTDSTMHYKGELTVVLKYIPEEKNLTLPLDQVQGMFHTELNSVKSQVTESVFGCSERTFGNKNNGWRSQDGPFNPQCAELVSMLVVAAACWRSVSLPVAQIQLSPNSLPSHLLNSWNLRTNLMGSQMIPTDPKCSDTLLKSQVCTNKRCLLHVLPRWLIKSSQIYIRKCYKKCDAICKVTSCHPAFSQYV